LSVRILLCCVGRSARAPEQQLCDAYVERARGIGTRLGFTKTALCIVDTSRAASTPARMKEEGEKLIRYVPEGGHVIALDVAGRARGSEDFAKHLAALRDRGLRDAAFVIGGPDGLAPKLRDGAAEKLSLGPQTWPHLLVRAMLAEQIYRAMTILAGHPYHRQ
jgi:23S rRNA (pseudouridine1915-N3)-methyltransferase